MFKNSTIILLTLLFSLASLLYGCNTASDSDIYWFRDPVGFFHTNDLERAQQEIPFTIILPSYLPEDMGLSTLKIYGPIDISLADDLQGLEVDISYISGDREIYIDQDNLGLVMSPNPDLGFAIVEISGVKVLRQATGIEEGISFNWNCNKIHYEARFYSIDADEATKVVESMIEQME